MAATPAESLQPQPSASGAASPPPPAFLDDGLPLTDGTAAGVDALAPPPAYQPPADGDSSPGCSNSCCCELLVRSGIATVWFALSLALAVLIPNIGDVIRMLGSLAAVFIFLLPGLGLFQLVQRSDPSLYRLKAKVNTVLAFVFVGIGAFLFGVVFTQGIQANAGGTDTAPEPLCHY